MHHRRRSDKNSSEKTVAFLSAGVANSQRLAVLIVGRKRRFQTGGNGYIM
jgi:hypothetical protein